MNYDSSTMISYESYVTPFLCRVGITKLFSSFGVGFNGPFFDAF